MSKQLSTLLRHGHLPREEDGAIEFWRLKDYLRYDFVRSRHCPSDGILEGLYKLRVRVSEKLKTVLELYNMEIHQKK